MKQLQSVLVISLLLASSALQGQQKVESKFGKGVYVVANDSSFSMKFNARVQSLLMFEAPADSENLMDDMTSN